MGKRPDERKEEGRHGERRWKETTIWNGVAGDESGGKNKVKREEESGDEKRQWEERKQEMKEEKRAKCESERLLGQIDSCSWDPVRAQSGERLLVTHTHTHLTTQRRHSAPVHTQIRLIAFQLAAYYRHKWETHTQSHVSRRDAAGMHTHTLAWCRQAFSFAASKRTHCIIIIRLRRTHTQISSDINQMKTRRRAKAAPAASV